MASRPAPADRNKSSAQKVKAPTRAPHNLFDPENRRRWDRADIQRLQQTGTRPAPLFRPGGITPYRRPGTEPGGGLSSTLAARYRIWQRSPKFVTTPSGQRIDVGGGGAGFYFPGMGSTDPKVRAAAMQRWSDAYTRAILPAYERFQRAQTQGLLTTIPGVYEGTGLAALQRAKNVEQSVLEEQQRVASAFDPLEVRARYTQPLAPWESSVSTFQAERMYGLQPGSSIYQYRPSGTKEDVIPLQPAETRDPWILNPTLRKLDRGRIAAQLGALGDNAQLRLLGLDEIPDLPETMPNQDRDKLIEDAYNDAYEAYLEKMQAWNDLLVSPAARERLTRSAREKGYKDPVQSVLETDAAKEWLANRKRGEARKEQRGRGATGQLLDLTKAPDLAWTETDISDYLKENRAIASEAFNLSKKETRVPVSSLNVIKRIKENGKTYVIVRSGPNGLTSKMRVERLPPRLGGKEVAVATTWVEDDTIKNIRDAGWGILRSIVYGDRGPSAEAPRARLRVAKGYAYSPDQQDGDLILDGVKDLAAWYTANSEPIDDPNQTYAVNDWVERTMSRAGERAWKTAAEGIQLWYSQNAKGETRDDATAKFVQGVRNGLRASTMGTSEIPAGVINFLDRVVSGDDASGAAFDAARQSLGMPVVLRTASLPEEHRQYLGGLDAEGAASAIAATSKVDDEGRRTALEKATRDALEAQAIANSDGRLAAGEAARMSDTQLIDRAYSTNSTFEQIAQNFARNVSEIPALPAGILAVGQEVKGAAGGTREEQLRALQTVVSPILDYWLAWSKAIAWTASGGQFGSTEDLQREAYNNPLWTGLSALQGAGTAARIATIVGRAGMVAKLGRVGAAYNNLAKTEQVIAQFPESDQLSRAARGRAPAAGFDESGRPIVDMADLTPEEAYQFERAYDDWAALSDDMKADIPEPEPIDFFDLEAQYAQALSGSGVSLGYARPNIVAQVRKRIQKSLFESDTRLGNWYRKQVLRNRGKDVINDAQRVARAVADDRVQPLVKLLNKLPRLERARAAFDLTVATRFLIPERFGVVSPTDVTPGLVAKKLQENLDANEIAYVDPDSGDMIVREITNNEVAQVKATIAFLEELDKADPSRANDLFAQIRAAASLIESDNIQMIHAMGIGGDIIRRLDDLSLFAARDAVEQFRAAARARVETQIASEEAELQRIIGLQEEGAFAGRAPMFQGAHEFARDVENLPLSTPEMLDAASAVAATLRDSGSLAEDARKLAARETDLTPEEIGPGRAKIRLRIDNDLMSPERMATGEPLTAEEAARIIEQNTVLALAGIDHSAWYRQAADAVKQITNNPQDAALVTAIIAVTSPQRKILPNIGDLRSLYLAMKEVEGQRVNLREIPQIGNLTWLNADRFNALQELHDTGVIGWLFRGASGRADIPLDSANDIDRVAVSMSGKSLGSLLNEPGLFRKFRRGERNDVKTSRFFYAIFKNIDSEFADEIADLLGISKRGSTADVWDMVAKRIFAYADGEAAIGSAAATETAEFAHQVNRATLRQLRQIADELGDPNFARIVDAMDEDGVQAAVWVGARNAAGEGWSPGTPLTFDDTNIAQRARNRSYGGDEEVVTTYTGALRAPGISETIRVTAAPGADATEAARARWAEMSPRQQAQATRNAAAAVRDYFQENNILASIDSFGDDVVDGVRVPSITVRVAGRREFSVEKLTGVKPKTASGTVLRRLTEEGLIADLEAVRALYTGSKKDKGTLDALKFALKHSERGDDYWNILGASVARVGEQLDQDAMEYARTIGHAELEGLGAVSLANSVYFNFVSDKRPTAAQIETITQRATSALAEMGMPNATVSYQHVRGGDGILTIDNALDGATLSAEDARSVAGAMRNIDAMDPQSVAGIMGAKGVENVAVKAVADALDELDFIGPTKISIRVDVRTIPRSEYASRIRARSRRIPESGVSERGRRTIAAREAAAAERLGRRVAGDELSPGLFRTKGERDLARPLFQADGEAGIGARGAVAKDARSLASGQFILYLFRNRADASTLIHELVGHVIARDLFAVDPDSLRVLEDFIGRRYKQWTVDDHERIARLAEEYFRTGRVPRDARKRGAASNVALGRAMRSLKTIMTDLYHAVAYSLSGEPRVTTRGGLRARGEETERVLYTDLMSDDVRSVFDNYFGVPPNTKIKPVASKARVRIRNAAIASGIAEDQVDQVLTILDARAHTWARITKKNAGEWYEDPRGAAISDAVVRDGVWELDKKAVAKRKAEVEERISVLNERINTINLAAEERMRRILRESPERSVLFAPTYRSPLAQPSGAARGGIGGGKEKLGSRGRRRSQEAVQLGRFLFAARDQFDEAAYVSEILRGARVPTEIYEYLLSVMRAFKQDGIVVSGKEAIEWVKNNGDPENWVAIQVDDFGVGGRRTKGVRSEEIRRILGADNDLSEEGRFAEVAREIVREHGMKDLEDGNTYVLVPRELWIGFEEQLKLIERKQNFPERLTYSWQRLALTTLPRTPIANIVGSGVLAATRGFSPQAVREALRIARSSDPGMWPAEIRNTGLYGSLLGPISDVKDPSLRTVSRGIRWWMDSLQTLNVMSEDYARLIVFVQAVMEEANKSSGKKLFASLRRMNDDAQLLFDAVLNGVDSAETAAIRARAMRSVEDWVGRYRRGGQFERTLSALVPFNQWYRHMIRLYFLTMPFNYPGRSAVMQGLSQMGADYLIEHGVFPEWYADVFPYGEERRDIIGQYSTGDYGPIGEQRSIKAIRTGAMNPYATAAMVGDPASTVARSLNPFLTFVVQAFAAITPKGDNPFSPALVGQSLTGDNIYLSPKDMNLDRLKFMLRLIEDRVVPLGIMREGGKFDTSSTTLNMFYRAFGIDPPRRMYQGPAGDTLEESVAPARTTPTDIDVLFMRFLGFSPIRSDAEGLASMARTMRQMQRQMENKRQANIREAEGIIRG